MTALQAVGHRTRVAVQGLSNLDWYLLRVGCRRDPNASRFLRSERIVLRDAVHPGCRFAIGPADSTVDRHCAERLSNGFLDGDGGRWGGHRLVFQTGQALFLDLGALTGIKEQSPEFACRNTIRDNQASEYECAPQVPNLLTASNVRGVQRAATPGVVPASGPRSRMVIRSSVHSERRRGPVAFKGLP